MEKKKKTFEFLYHILYSILNRTDDKYYAFSVQMVRLDALEELQNTFRVIHKIVQRTSQIFVISSVQIMMKRHSKEFVMNGCHI